MRFQHSKIRPVFSGCGRSVTGTLDEIRNGTLEVGDLPPIQVLVGPVDDTDPTLGPWYFSLNNRRLWVLKQCHREGLLDNEKYNNKIAVRVRLPKSGAEAGRYTVHNCALEAKFMREGGGGGGVESKKKRKGKGKDVEEELVEDTQSIQLDEASENAEDEEEDDDDIKVNRFTLPDDDTSDSESDDNTASQNPFSALM